jgi:hypothetical protein
MPSRTTWPGWQASCSRSVPSGCASLARLPVRPPKQLSKPSSARPWILLQHSCRCRSKERRVAASPARWGTTVRSRCRGVAATTNHLRAQIARRRFGFLIFVASPGHQDSVLAAVLPVGCVLPAHDPRTGIYADRDLRTFVAREHARIITLRRVRRLSRHPQILLGSQEKASEALAAPFE